MMYGPAHDIDNFFVSPFLTDGFQILIVSDVADFVVDGAYFAVEK